MVIVRFTVRYTVKGLFWSVKTSKLHDINYLPLNYNYTIKTDMAEILSTQIVFMPYTSARLKTHFSGYANCQLYFLTDQVSLNKDHGH